MTDQPLNKGWSVTSVGRRQALLLPVALALRARPAHAAEPQPGSALFEFNGHIPKGITYSRHGRALAWDGAAFRAVAKDQPRFVSYDGGRQALLIEGNLDRVIPDVAGWGAGTPVSDSPLEGGRALQVMRHPAVPAPGRPLFKPKDDQLVTASVYVRTPGPSRWSIALRSPYLNEVSSAEAETDNHWSRIVVTRPAYVSEEDALDFHPVWSGPDWSDTDQSVAAGPGLVWGAQAEAGTRASSPLPPGEASRQADLVLMEGRWFAVPEGCVRLDLPDGATRGSALLDGEDDGLQLALNASGRLVAKVGPLRLEGFGDATGHTVVELSWSAAGIGLGSGRGEVHDRAFEAGPGAVPDPGSLVRLLARKDGSGAANTALARLEISPNARIAGPVRGPILVPSGYALSFADEFDDPDTLRINEDGRWDGGGPFWRSRHRWSRFEVINKEKQIYMDRAFAGDHDVPLGVDPFAIAGSILTITAAAAAPQVRTAIKNYAYTSGMITSATSHAQTYGYFEIRCRVPAGRGFWPAFWLLPLAETWPPEVDILEASGARRFSVSTGAIGTGAPFAQLWMDDRGDVTQSFHTYGLEWTQTEMVLFMDGTEIRRGTNFVNQPMFIVANLAIGSHEPRWIPDPDASTPLPARFEIDHIRCWSRR